MKIKKKSVKVVILRLYYRTLIVVPTIIGRQGLKFLQNAKLLMIYLRKLGDLRDIRNAILVVTEIENEWHFASKLIGSDRARPKLRITQSLRQVTSMVDTAVAALCSTP